MSSNKESRSRGFSPQDQQDAIVELDKVRADWLKRPGVTAVDVGLKYVDGKPTNQLALRVHVEHKLPLENVPPNDRFPSHLGRFPVDVIEASYGPQITE